VDSFLLRYDAATRSNRNPKFRGGGGRKGVLSSAKVSPGRRICTHFRNKVRKNFAPNPKQHTIDAHYGCHVWRHAFRHNTMY
jgi:hypothetical protein